MRKKLPQCGMALVEQNIKSFVEEIVIRFDKMRPLLCREPFHGSRLSGEFDDCPGSIVEVASLLLGYDDLFQKVVRSETLFSPISGQ